MKPGDRVAERFEIQCLVGTGGMGRVFRARDLSTGQPAAVKVVAEGADRDHEVRLDREARVLASLEHPHIVRYLGHGLTPGGGFFLAMEWLVGEDLGERLARGPLTMLESFELARRVAEALVVAHQRGISHRDIKPSNLFLVGGAIAGLKVLDFGLAAGATYTRITASGAWMGTPGYMSPEQARGGKLGPQTDVFALGSVLFECLTGLPVFTGASIIAILGQLVQHAPPELRKHLPDAPESLERLLLRMLATDPANRPANASVLLEEMAAIPMDGSWAQHRSFPPAITTQERRLVCVLVVGNAKGLAVAETVTVLPTVPARVTELVARHGGHCEQLANGACLVALWGAGEALDLAAAAARLATELRDLQGEPVAVAMGPGVPNLRISSALVERAASIFRPGDRCIVLDDTTAGLLDGRFETERDNGRWLLVGREASLDANRRLLGRPTPCIGRERDIAMLLATYDEVAQEHVARAMIVTGPAGAGKSRVRQEFLRRLQERGASPLTLMGRGDPLRTSSPLGLIAPMLRDAAGIRAHHGREAARERLRSLMKRVLPREAALNTAAFLGEIIGVPFDEAEVPALVAARADSAVIGDRMRAAVEDWLVAESELRPIVLIAEDLHWSDGASVKLLDSLLARMAERPLFILALARPEVLELYPRLWDQRATQHVSLAPLTKRACEQLAKMLLGERAASELVTRLIERSGGNAFFLEELIRAAVEGNEALPDTLAATMQRRLEQLDASARRVLRAGSVFGGRFRRSGVQALLGGHFSAAELRQTLATLVAQELLSNSVDHAAMTRASVVSNDAVLSFRHGLLRDAAYASLTDADRHTGHRLAASWLIETGEVDAGLIADHFERAAVPERAIPYWIQAAKFALEAQDYDLAVRSAERGIVAGAAGEVRGRLRRMQSEAHSWAYRWDESRRLAREAMELSVEGSDTWFRAAGDLGIALAIAGQWDEYDDKLAPLSRAVDVHGPKLSEDGALGALSYLFGHFCFNPGRQRAEPQRLLESLGKIEVSTRPRVSGLLARLGSLLARYDGELDVAMRRSLESERAFELAGDLRNRDGERQNYAAHAIILGVNEEARRTAQALGQSRDPAMQGAAQGLLGILAMREGHYEEALKCFDESIRRFGKGEFPFRYRALVLCKLGRDLDQALASAEQALSLTDVASEAQCLATLAHVRRDRGEADQALALAERAVRCATEIHQFEGTAYPRLELAQCLLALGRTREAAECVQVGAKELRNAAQKIVSGTLRAGFLLRIPHHRELLGLVRESGAGRA